MRACEIARSLGWVEPTLAAMEGLEALYRHTGRSTEWKRLVDEFPRGLVEASSGGPLPGLETEWAIVTRYRAGLATAEAVLGAFPADAASALPEQLFAWRRNPWSEQFLRGLYDRLFRYLGQTRRLRGPALMLAQQLPQLADQLQRQAAVVPPFKERVGRLPGREISREGPPLDAVLDHVGHRVAHRPQVMCHRAADGDGEVRHHLPGPWLEYCPLLIGQVRRVPRRAVTAPAARRRAARAGVPGRGRVNRHENPWRRRWLVTSPLPGVHFVSYAKTPHSDQIDTLTPRTPDLHRLSTGS